ncbi:uncharacterized protein LOC102366832 isoform X2 [Latimeria chalumnae]|uniref:uncharacterized protein LOC102366832 isoform X2 n=1 Tax=Latimeria chalumnae TaxID=7897 RepID=UPI00313DDFF5
MVSTGKKHRAEVGGTALSMVPTLSQQWNYSKNISDQCDLLEKQVLEERSASMTNTTQNKLRSQLNKTVKDSTIAYEKSNYQNKELKRKYDIVMVAEDAGTIQNIGKDHKRQHFSSSLSTLLGNEGPTYKNIAEDLHSPAVNKVTYQGYETSSLIKPLIKHISPPSHGDGEGVLKDDQLNLVWITSKNGFSKSKLSSFQNIITADEFVDDDLDYLECSDVMTKHANAVWQAKLQGNEHPCVIDCDNDDELKLIKGHLNEHDHFPKEKNEQLQVSNDTVVMDTTVGFPGNHSKLAVNKDPFTDSQSTSQSEMVLTATHYQDNVPTVKSEEGCKQSVATIAKGNGSVTFEEETAKKHKIEKQGSGNCKTALENVPLEYNSSLSLDDFEGDQALKQTKESSTEIYLDNNTLQTFAGIMDQYHDESSGKEWHLEKTQHIDIDKISNVTDFEHVSCERLTENKTLVFGMTSDKEGLSLEDYQFPIHLRNETETFESHADIVPLEGATTYSISEKEGINELVTENGEFTYKGDNTLVETQDSSMKNLDKCLNMTSNLDEDFDTIQLVPFLKETMKSNLISLQQANDIVLDGESMESHICIAQNDCYIEHKEAQYNRVSFTSITEEEHEASLCVKEQYKKLGDKETNDLKLKVTQECFIENAGNLINMDGSMATTPPESEYPSLNSEEIYSNHSTGKRLLASSSQDKIDNTEINDNIKPFEITGDCIFNTNESQCDSYTSEGKVNIGLENYNVGKNLKSFVTSEKPLYTVNENQFVDSPPVEMEISIFPTEAQRSHLESTEKCVNMTSSCHEDTVSMQLTDFLTETSRNSILASQHFTNIEWKRESVELHGSILHDVSYIKNKGIPYKDTSFGTGSEEQEYEDTQGMTIQRENLETKISNSSQIKATLQESFSQGTNDVLIEEEAICARFSKSNFATLKSEEISNQDDRSRLLVLNSQNKNKNTNSHNYRESVRISDDCIMSSQVITTDVTQHDSYVSEENFIMAKENYDWSEQHFQSPVPTEKHLFLVKEHQALNNLPINIVTECSIAENSNIIDINNGFITNTSNLWEEMSIVGTIDNLIGKEPAELKTQIFQIQDHSHIKPRPRTNGDNKDNAFKLDCETSNIAQPLLSLHQVEESKVISTYSSDNQTQIEDQPVRNTVPENTKKANLVLSANEEILSISYLIDKGFNKEELLIVERNTSASDNQLESKDLQATSSTDVEEGSIEKKYVNIKASENFCKDNNLNVIRASEHPIQIVDKNNSIEQHVKFQNSFDLEDILQIKEHGGSLTHSVDFSCRHLLPAVSGTDIKEVEIFKPFITEISLITVMKEDNVELIGKNEPENNMTQKQGATTDFQGSQHKNYKTPSSKEQNLMENLLVKTQKDVIQNRQELQNDDIKNILSLVEYETEYLTFQPLEFQTIAAEAKEKINDLQYCQDTGAANVESLLGHMGDSRNTQSVNQVYNLCEYDNIIETRKESIISYNELDDNSQPSVISIQHLDHSLPSEIANQVTHLKDISSTFSAIPENCYEECQPRNESELQVNKDLSGLSSCGQVQFDKDKESTNKSKKNSESSDNASVKMSIQIAEPSRICEPVTTQDNRYYTALVTDEMVTEQYLTEPKHQMPCLTIGPNHDKSDINNDMKKVPTLLPKTSEKNAALNIDPNSKASVCCNKQIVTPKITISEITASNKTDTNFSQKGDAVSETNITVAVTSPSAENIQNPNEQGTHCEQQSHSSAVPVKDLTCGARRKSYQEKLKKYVHSEISLSASRPYEEEAAKRMRLSEGKVKSILAQMNHKSCKEEKENVSKNISLNKKEGKKTTELLVKKREYKEQRKAKQTQKEDNKAPQLLQKIHAEMFPDASVNIKLWCQFGNIHGDSTITWTKDSVLLAKLHRRR